MVNNVVNACDSFRCRRVSHRFNLARERYEVARDRLDAACSETAKSMIAFKKAYRSLIVKAVD